MGCRGFKEAISILKQLPESTMNLLGITSGRALMNWFVGALKDCAQKRHDDWDTVPTEVHMLEEVLQPMPLTRALDAYALSQSRIQGAWAPAPSTSSSSAFPTAPSASHVPAAPPPKRERPRPTAERATASPAPPDAVPNTDIFWYAVEDQVRARDSMARARWPANGNALPELPDHLQFQAGGIFPWNVKSDKPSPLIRLQSGSSPVCCVQRAKEKSLQEFVNTGAPQGHSPVREAQQAVNMVASFLWNRPGCWERLDGHFDVPEALQQTQSHGRFIGTRVKHRLPTLWKPNAKWETAYHGTTMCSVYRILMGGFAKGFAVISAGGQEKMGVYCHVLERAGLCVNYMLYSPLDESGYYIAPLFQIKYQTPDPQGRSQIVPRSTKSMKQALTYEDNCYVTGVCWHIMHFSEMCIGDKNTWLYMDARFKTAFELDPDEAWDVIAQRSRTAQVQVSCKQDQLHQMAIPPAHGPSFH